MLKCDKTNILSHIINQENSENKNIFYIPTFKSGYNGRLEGKDRNSNPFGIDEFDMKLLSKFLIENKFNLIVKLHPFEEQLYKVRFEKLNLKNIYFLSNDFLEKSNLDLYNCLNESDLLITDYSSVYFDYLVTYKPILFINVDEEMYKKERGFLLEPYEFWTPGPKVKTQGDLFKEILNLINDESYYMKERLNLLNIIHKYNDGSSSKRVWGFITENYLSRGKSNEFHN